MLQRSIISPASSVRITQRRHASTTACRALLNHFSTTPGQHHHHQQQRRRRSAPYSTGGAINTRHGAKTSAITKAGNGRDANNGDYYYFNTKLNRETVDRAVVRRGGVVTVARARKSTAASVLDEKEEEEDVSCGEALGRDGGDEVEGSRLRFFRLAGELYNQLTTTVYAT